LNSISEKLSKSKLIRNLKYEEKKNKLTSYNLKSEDKLKLHGKEIEKKQEANLNKVINEFQRFYSNQVVF